MGWHCTCGGHVTPYFTNKGTFPKPQGPGLWAGRAGGWRAGLQDSSVTVSSAAWRVAPLPWADSGVHCSEPSLVSLQGDPAEGVSAGACLLAELGFWVPSCRVATPPAAASMISARLSPSPSNTRGHKPYNSQLDRSWFSIQNQQEMSVF